MCAIANGNLDRCARALVVYIEGMPDLREKVLDGINKKTEDLNQLIVDGIKVSVAHHTKSAGGNRHVAEETFVKNVVVASVFKIVKEGHKICKADLIKSIGASRNQI